MAIGQNFYADQTEQDFSNLSRQQSAQALGFGDQAARYADPFMNQRGQYQNHLSQFIGKPQDNYYQDQTRRQFDNTAVNPYESQLQALFKNPGEMASSPTYQFAFEQGLDALNRRSAATGKTGSGNYLADLMKYGQGLASQQFGQQANLLMGASSNYGNQANQRAASLSNAGQQFAGQNMAQGNLLAQLAQGGASPAAAGLSYAQGANRSQDYAQLAQMARSAGQNKGQQPGLPQGGGMNYMRGFDESMKSAFPGSGYSGGTGLPSGGMGGPGTAGYYGDPRSMSDAQLAAITGSYGGGMNSGYVQNNETGGTTTFGGAGYASPTGYTPGTTDYGGMGSFAGNSHGESFLSGGGGDFSIPDYSGDFGGGDYIGGYEGGYGGEEW